MYLDPSCLGTDDPPITLCDIVCNCEELKEKFQNGLGLTTGQIFSDQFFHHGSRDVLSSIIKSLQVKSALFVILKHARSVTELIPRTCEVPRNDSTETEDIFCFKRLSKERR